MTTTQKYKVCLLFGGRSAEHEISILSANNIYHHLQQRGHSIVPVYISHDGKWSQLLPEAALLNLLPPNHRLLISMGLAGRPAPKNLPVAEASFSMLPRLLDQAEVFFPVLHGPSGEDGSIQGFFKLMNVPYVGCQILGSAVTLDKDVTKRLLRDAGVPVVRWKVVERHQLAALKADDFVNQLGLPVFVKAANLGSSIGTSRVDRIEELIPAIEQSLQFDSKVLIEEAIIPVREIECGVIGNDHPRASMPGEVISHHRFYSYEAKYLDEKGASLEVPAKLSEDELKLARALAMQAFQALCCRGLARVDMFMTKAGTFFVNEVNSMPGFTNISMFPRMWESAGLPQPELLEELIRLALEQHKTESALRISYQG